MIRKHTEEDLEAIMNIWMEASSLAHPFLNPAFVEKVKSDMRTMYIPGSETWVYEIDGSIAGFISMIENEIGGLFVWPKQHSNGIGSKLVHYVSEFNEQLEVEVFEKNRIGRSFYDKMGFRTERHYMHEQSGERVLRLKK